jgi:hypothetical protein
MKKNKLINLIFHFNEGGLLKNKTEDKSSVLKYIDLKNSIPSEIT